MDDYYLTGKPIPMSEDNCISDADIEQLIEHCSPCLSLLQILSYTREEIISGTTNNRTATMVLLARVLLSADLER